MTERSTAPDSADLEIPIDAWTQPFWSATAEHRLVFPRCGDCKTFRWPPGPFCPECQSQAVEWMPAGPGRLYSFTIVPGVATAWHIPALIEFPDAGNIRLLAPIVGALPAEVVIGATVKTGWTKAANASVPVFSLADQG